MSTVYDWQMLARLMRRLRRVIWRDDRTLWGFYAVAAVFLLHLLRYATSQPLKSAEPDGDGFYTWIYARSLAFDFDIHLANDYALCGDIFNAGIDEGGGRPANPLYFGPALLLAPVTFVVKTLLSFGPEVNAKWSGGCSGPIVYFVGYSAVIATTLTVWIGYRIARRFYSEGACAVAVVVVGLASPLNVFGTLSWYYSHVWAALAVAVSFLTAFRAHEAPENGRSWLVAGLGCGFAALMRTQESLWLLLPLASIATHALSTRKTHAMWRGTALLRVLLLGAGFIVVYAIQLYVYRRIYGSAFVIPQGKLYLQLSHAHPWLLLFSARSGLLYWTPLLWLAVVGMPLLVANRRMGLLGAAIVVASAANIYVASAALSWTGSGTIGARVQTSLAAPLLFAIGASATSMLRWAAQRRIRAPAALLLALAPWIWTTWMTGTAGMPNDRVVAAPELYSGAVKNGVSTIYRNIGNPWTLPATLVFSTRYHAPPRVFDQLASDGMWAKDYRTLEVLTTDTLTFKTPPPAFYGEDLAKFAARELGVRPGEQSRFLVTLYWPWVTAVRVTARPVSGPATLTIKSASFWRTRELGKVRFERKDTVEIAVPPDAFDSGINEVILHSDAPTVLESWQWLDTSPHDTSIRLIK
ncbi:MAG: hypothetical protein KF819_07965 [Labilithrix sp.]|nr:hypothetical protein [Labilithrix sp.]